MKPKEYLLKKGHLKEIKRGRLSREHIAIIEEAVRGGVKIEGYSLSTGPSTDKPKVEVKKEFTGIADLPDETRPESSWRAFRVSDNKEIGMRTVCNVCKNSLTYCFCPSPTVWADFQTESKVTFKAKRD